MNRRKIQADAKKYQRHADALKIVNRANELTNDWKTFEEGTLARTNKELYAILGGVYALYKDAHATGCMQEAMEKLRTVLASRGMKVQKNSNPVTVFVRYVTNSDRKRAYNYASTILSAKQAGVEPTDLAAYIEKQGGVEECKKTFTKSPEQLQKEKQLTSAEEIVFEQLQTMAPVQVVKLPGANVTLSEDTQFAFVIARSRGDGTFELLRAIPVTSTALENAAIKELAKVSVKGQQQVVSVITQNGVNKATEAAADSIKTLELADA